ncbi:MAG: hypothetical protein KH329_07485, partial [Bifidobacterium longum]|nr:hypothetical protein [Bifidobacterium longum]
MAASHTPARCDDPRIARPAHRQRLQHRLLSGRHLRIANDYRADHTGTIANAQLWSPDSPTLYTARTELHDANGTLLDTHAERFGIRALTFDARQGLRINGKCILLNGGCVHHDNGILGAATLPQAEYRRARIMKEQGFNAVRSAHNPLSKAFLDACDELGLLVMDEAFDMWWIHKTSYDYAASFRDHYADDLASMVRKDRNHPSVILYSIGNEIADTKSPRAAEAARSMVGIIRSLDAERPVIDCVNPISLSIAAKTQAGVDEHDAKVEGEPARRQGRGRARPQHHARTRFRSRHAHGHRPTHARRARHRHHRPTDQRGVRRGRRGRAELLPPRARMVPPPPPRTRVLRQRN